MLILVIKRIGNLLGYASIVALPSMILFFLLIPPPQFLMETTRLRTGFLSRQPAQRNYRPLLKRELSLTLRVSLGFFIAALRFPSAQQTEYKEAPCIY